MSYWGLPPFRSRLPRLTDRRALGATGLQVSPLCLGITGSPDTVAAAFDLGVNFFFLTADLHWPLYEDTRRGLERLLDRGGSVRDRLVVAVVSYLSEPLFGALQVHEVVNAVRGLERVDLLVAGAVPHLPDLYERARSLGAGRAAGVGRAMAIGASFHDRHAALTALNHDLLDLAYVRYNTRHDGARRDLFPHLRANRRALVYNFKSTMFRATDAVLDAARLPPQAWRPAVTDHYRFVLSQPAIDGVLASPFTPEEVEGIAAALDRGPLSPEEQEYMVWLSAVAHPATVMP